ncbi:hypothetical protein AB9P05_08870 [Roseivirga sp. BDSF3-8]|uniref:hypothetical protein n=1 Tax=Roseivirga sp. BDSF3-8 TaxID=3241598 RepID=UPI003531EA5C
MIDLKKSIFLFSLVMLGSMLTGCLDADSDAALPDEAVCDPSSPAVNLTLYRVLTNDSFEGITLTELGREESVRYDSLAFVLRFKQGPSCPTKQEAVDSANLISLNTYDDNHPPYTRLNDVMEVVLQSEQAIYPVGYESYSPGDENQFIVLLSEAPDSEGVQQFGLWYDGRVYQLSFPVYIRR